MLNAEYIIDSRKNLLYYSHLLWIAVGDKDFKIWKSYFIILSLNIFEQIDEIVKSFPGYKTASSVERFIDWNYSNNINKRHGIAVYFIRWIDDQNLGILNEKLPMFNMRDIKIGKKTSVVAKFCTEISRLFRLKIICILRRKRFK